MNQLHTSTFSNNQLTILKKEYLEITGDFCAAKLIHYFEQWQNWKLAVQRTEWIYQPIKNIYADLFCEHSKHVINRSIQLLMDLGLLERRNNPGNMQDKTYQYKLNINLLRELTSQKQVDVNVDVDIDVQVHEDVKTPETIVDTPKLRSELSEFNVEQHQIILTNIPILKEINNVGTFEEEVQEEEIQDIPVQEYYDESEELEKTTLVREVVGISPGIKSLIVNFTLEQVKRAIAYVEKKKDKIKDTKAYFYDCLKNRRYESQNEASTTENTTLSQLKARYERCCRETGRDNAIKFELLPRDRYGIPYISLQISPGMYAPYGLEELLTKEGF